MTYRSLLVGLLLLGSGCELFRGVPLDAVLVHEEPVVWPDNDSMRAFAVLDAHADGQNVFVTVASGPGPGSVLLSRDGAKTFTLQAVPSFSDVQSTRGVHVFGDEVIHVALGPDGQHLRRLDAALTQFLPNEDLRPPRPSRLTYQGRGPRLALWGAATNGVGVPEFDAYQYDLSTKTFTTRLASGAGAPLSVANTRDAERFTALFQAGLGLGVCVASYEFGATSGAAATRSECVDRPLLPQALATGRVFEADDGSLAVVAAEDGGLFVWPVDAALTPLDPTRIRRLPGDFKDAVEPVDVHPRAGGAVARLRDTEGEAFVFARGPALELLRFPPLCTGAACGDDLLSTEWLVPVPGAAGQFYVFESLVPRTDKTRPKRLYVRRLEPTKTPLPIEGTSPQATDFGPNRPATPLLRGCARAAACGKYPFMECVNALAVGTDGCAGRNDFLAAASKPTHDEACAALAPLPAAVGALRCSFDGPVCESNQPRCEGETAIGCGTRAGQTAMVTQCDDLGLFCDRGGCVSKSTASIPRCANSSTRYWGECSGTILSWCATSDLEQFLDCASLGYARCIPPDRTGAVPRPARCGT